MKKIIFGIMVACISLLFGSCQSVLNKAVEAGIEQAKKDLPIDLEEGLVMDDIAFIDDGIVCHITVNEELYDMELFEEIASELKEEAIAGFKESLPKDKDLHEFLSGVVDLNIPLNFDYVGDTSGEVVRVTISPKELKEIVKNK